MRIYHRTFGDKTVIVFINLSKSTYFSQMLSLIRHHHFKNRANRTHSMTLKKIGALTKIIVPRDFGTIL